MVVPPFLFLFRLDAFVPVVPGVVDSLEPELTSNDPEDEDDEDVDIGDEVGDDDTFFSFEEVDAAPFLTRVFSTGSTGEDLDTSDEPILLEDDDEEEFLVGTTTISEERVFPEERIVSGITSSGRSSQLSNPSCSSTPVVEDVVAQLAL